MTVVYHPIVFVTNTNERVRPLFNDFWKLMGKQGNWHSWTSASRTMPPASAFRHPVTQSGTRTFRYQTGSSYSGTGLGPLIPVPVPDWFWHRHFCSFRYPGTGQSDIPAYKKKYTPCTSILLAVERHTYTLHTAHPYSWLWKWLHPARLFCWLWKGAHPKPVFLNVHGAPDWFQGMNSAGLCSLAGRYDNPIPPRFLAPIDFLKIPALHVHTDVGEKGYALQVHSPGCGNGYTLHVYTAVLVLVMVKGMPIAQCPYARPNCR